MKKITFAFFGSAYFSADLLEKILMDQELKNCLDIKLVVTQPDKPAGRKQIMTPTPVKQIAQKYDLRLMIYDSKSLDLKSVFLNLDFVLTYAFGAIIPKEILDVPKYGFWNIHPSLLPLYRGTAPMAAPLIKGDKETGVTIIKMDDMIDHGPIIAQNSYTIIDTDYRPDLEKKLTDLGFAMFKKLVLKLHPTGYSLLPIDQDHSKATYTQKLKKKDGYIPYELLKFCINPKSEILNSKQIQSIKIQNPKLFEILGIGNWNLFRILDLDIRVSSEKIFNLFRGLYPWPGIWTIIPDKPHFAKATRGKRLKITGMKLISPSSLHPTGYTLLPTMVQLEGKKEVDFETFIRAFPAAGFRA